MIRSAAGVVMLVMACDPGTLPGDGGFPRGSAPDGGVPPPTRLLTPEGSSWYDPEVFLSPEGPLLTFQDERGQIFLGWLDGGSVHRIQLMGQGAAPLTRTYNGPEFGQDRGGWATYYTRRTSDGGVQAVRSRVASGLPITDVVPVDGLFTPLASKDPTAPSTRLIGVQRSGRPGWGTALWLDLAAPESPTPLFFLDERTDGDLRWITGSQLIVGTTCPGGPSAPCLIDTATGSSEPIAAAGQASSSPYGWFAPETDGGLHALAVVGGTTVQIWRRDPAGWVAAGQLGSPEADAGLAYLGSPEPFVAGGRSLVSLATSRDAEVTPGATEQHIWILSLDVGRPYAARCDDRAPGPLSRVDPEVLVVGEVMYVFYYVIDAGGSRVFVCELPVP